MRVGSCGWRARTLVQQLVGPPPPRGGRRWHGEQLRDSPLNGRAACWLAWWWAVVVGEAPCLRVVAGPPPHL